MVERYSITFGSQGSNGHERTLNVSYLEGHADRVAVLIFSRYDSLAVILSRRSIGRRVIIASL